MKNKLMLVLGLLVASSAMATSLAPRVPMAKLELNYYGTRYETILDNYNQLTVTEMNSQKVVGKKSLKVESMQLLSSLSLDLADSEVKTTQAQIVCMMMPGPIVTEALDISETNQNNSLFNGKLRLVLSNEGCYERSHTQPTDENSLAQARTLRTMLEVFTYEAANLSRP